MQNGWKCGTEQSGELDKKAWGQVFSYFLAQFFSVPGHTPILLQEAGDCGTTYVRFNCRNGGASHESRLLETYCPPWVTDIVCQVSILVCVHDPHEQLGVYMTLMS